MSTPHLEERWIDANGELAIEPQTRLSIDDDAIGGLEKFARVFRPGRVKKLRIVLEGWENDLGVQWGWDWNPACFVGGVAYRYAFGGDWTKWTIDHSYSFSPGKRPDADGMGISMKVQQFGVMFAVEVVLIGLCGMSRGPVTQLEGYIPPECQVPKTQPALLIQEMINFQD